MGHPSLSPLVGRDAEVETLRRVLSASRPGEPHLVLVEGEAGIGKSRLVEEAMAYLPADTVVLRAGCSSLGFREIPWAPVTQVLGDLHRSLGPAAFARAADPFARRIASLVPAQAEEPPDGHEYSPGQLYAAVAHVLLRAAASNPTVVVVEDVHWADRASWAALEHLVGSAREQPIAFLLTRRDPDPEAPAGAELADLVHARRPTWIRLERLPPADVALLLEHLQGTATSARLADWVSSLSGGVPFLVEELVAAGVDGRNGIAASDLVERVPGLRLDPLGPTARAVVDAASLAVGLPTAHDLLHASGVAEAGLDGALTEVLGRGVLERRDGALGFRHALVREAALERLMPHAATQLHARWADVLAPRTDLASVTARAQHLLRADRPAMAVDACLMAAELARRSSAFPAQTAMLKHAADLWTVVPNAAELTGRTLGEVLSDAADASFRGASDTDETVALIDRARAAWGSNGPEEVAAWLGVLWIMCQGGTGQSISDKLRLVGAIPAVPTSRRRVSACTMAAEWLCEAARPEDAEQYAIEAVAGAQALNDDSLESEALIRLAGAQGRRGDLDAALVTMRRARSLAERSGDLWTLALQAVFEGGLLCNAGQLQDASVVYGDALARLGGSRPGALPFAWAMVSLNLAETWIDLGRWDEAATLLDRVLSEGRIHDRSLVYAKEVRARLRLWRDGATEADESLPDFQHVVPDLENTELQDVVAAQRLLIDRLAELGDLPSARAVLLLLTHVNGVEQKPDNLYPALLAAARLEADAAHGLVDDPEPRARDDVIRSIRSALDQLVTVADLHRAYSAHIRAELARAERSDDSAGWASVVDLWRSTSTPRSLALALLRLAEAAASEEQRREARRALVEAMDVATRLGAQPLLRDGRLLAARAGVRLPIVAQQRRAGTSLELTTRELDVLRLVASGESNATIAEHLFISPKTVSVHLVHINEKLGVGSRTAAVAEAQARGLFTVDSGTPRS